jgi:hypothetical protein
MKKRLILCAFLSLSLAAISAQEYQQINLSKIISFPAKYEGKAVAIMGYQVHGEVKPLGNSYGLLVTLDTLIFLPAYSDKVTFLVNESIAEKITDVIESGYWIWANIYGHIEQISNSTAFSPATCIVVDRIDLLQNDGRLYKQIRK